MNHNISTGQKYLSENYFKLQQYNLYLILEKTYQEIRFSGQKPAILQKMNPFKIFLYYSSYTGILAKYRFFLYFK